MKVAKNAPCPCGSGKKYKKCCLLKDLEEKPAPPKETTQRPAAAPVVERPQPPAPPPPDPRLEAFNARWKEFEAADYEGQIVLCIKTLDEEELMDGDMAFEMLNRIYYATAGRDERDRFDALVDMLRQRLPDVYAKGAHYYLDWRITNALVAGRFDAILPLVREMAPTAGEEIDVFNWTLDRLAYHGQLPVLVEAMRLGWPRVRNSAGIVPWGIDEFARRAVNYEVFSYVESHPAPDAQDPDLLHRLGTYSRINPAYFPQYLARLTGQTEGRWTLSDFEFEHRRHQRRDVWDEEDEADEPPPDPGRQNLYDLTVEFLGYLRRHEGVPYTKGELARAQIYEYILDRHEGELEPRESLFESMMPRHRDKRKKPKPRRPDHVLCPDRATLDRHLARRLDFINPQQYKVVATFELVPAWLRFLESRQLIDAEQRGKTLQHLRGLDAELLKIWKQEVSDPALQRELERWRENVDKQS
jgi:hypothetical protein